MTRRALLVSSASPYPVVTNGCARLVSDYLTHLFPADRVYLLLTRPGDWAPLGLYFGGQPVAGDLNVSGLLAHDFAFVLFIGFKENEFTLELARSRASFCLTDTYPHPDVPQGLFRGILSHRSGDPHPDLLIVGGSYDDEVFYPDRANRDRAGPDRGGEELVLSVGRIPSGQAPARSWSKATGSGSSRSTDSRSTWREVSPTRTISARWSGTSMASASSRASIRGSRSPVPTGALPGDRPALQPGTAVRPGLAEGELWPGADRGDGVRHHLCRQRRVPGFRRGGSAAERLRQHHRQARLRRRSRGPGALRRRSDRRFRVGQEVRTTRDPSGPVAVYR